MDTYAHTQDKPRIELAEKIEANFYKPANKCQALIFCNAANFRFILAFAQ